MITGKYPVQTLAPSSHAHILEEYVRGVRIKRAEEELRLRETQLIAQGNGLEIDLEEARVYTTLDDTYLNDLSEKMPKLQSALNKNTANELEKFVAYGTEIKYLPLFKYLQVSNKFVSTDEWRLARQEYLMSKAFERYKEACTVQLELQSNNLPRGEQGSRRVWWDGVLEEVKWMALDFKEEREWKRSLAKVLAEEAALFARCKLQRQPVKERFFYEPALLPELVSKLSLETKENNRATSPNSPDESINHTLISSSVMGKGWKDAEDQRLQASSCLYRGNWELVAEELNHFFHPLGYHKRTPAMCQERLRHLSAINSSTPHGTSGSVPEMLKEAERHFARFSVMQSARGKLVPLIRITPLTSLNNNNSSLSTSNRSSLKRPSSGANANAGVVHPSHDAAVKRATQNITRLLTPGELALRRMQRMRQLMEGMRQQPNNAVSNAPSTAPSNSASTQGTPLKKSSAEAARESRSTTPVPSASNSTSKSSKPPSRPTTPKK